MVRAGGANGCWHVEWAVKLNDLIGAPRLQGDKLVLNIKQVPTTIILVRSAVVFGVRIDPSITSRGWPKRQLKGY